ncbi:hypothetical protein [Desulfuribacillus alkaliarsenatis]|uniref:Uncharacterized protein n=1 Tax=Desulfuribacillus alkaliarsenatis TaxID=766136 RepID=A0A1E5G625_9FIRM|nr:hypothetical protein [Desulfuribacillus alkaliarsenatis]OEF98630.1 hypothetical protein BHF68_02915 [Desulfuribacillus alkaliarsenatis]
MSLKAIELQVAIPRTKDAGRIQEQLQQRPQNDQTQLANAQKKNIVKEQQKTLETQQTEHQKIKEHQEKHNKNSNQQQNKNRKNKSDKDNQKSTKHPFKGHSVDISL